MILKYLDKYSAIPKNNIRTVFLILVLVFVSTASIAQQAGNIYTPYSMYGLGSLDMQGNGINKQMGGIGVAVRSSIAQNSINPASYTAVPQKTFLVSLGLQGTSNYLQSASARSSHNGFTLGDFGVLFPLAKNIGFGLSITPYSTVGYKTQFEDTSEDILANIGAVDYTYSGTGGITQYKMGAGVTLFKGFSLGANFIYYLGTIERYNSIVIKPVVSTLEYRYTSTLELSRYNSISMDLGFQYTIKLNEIDKKLTIGGVYQPRINSKIKDETLTTSVGSGVVDTITNDSRNLDFKSPSKIAAGIYYESRKVSVGFDYITQDWKNSFALNPLNAASLTRYQDFRIGLQYVPNRFDIRNMFKRWSYRVGARYGTSYMAMYGQDIKDYSVTMGIGVPLQRNNFTLLNVGLEVGQMGSIKDHLIKDTYFRINVGVTLFGSSEWFTRYKFK